MSETMNIEQMMEVFKTLRTQLADLEKSVKGALKGSRVAKADKPKRAAGPWALWAKEMPSTHPAEFATYKAEKAAEAAAEGKKAKGVHILFAKMWRDSHTAEWDAFSTAAKAATSKGEVVKDIVKDIVKDKEEIKTPKAAKAPKTPNAPKKASKKAPKVEETEVSAELWTHKSTKYFRTGANECWFATTSGDMGKWAGVYDPIADAIDADADEPEIEA
jgi:hypothetical protein